MASNSVNVRFIIRNDTDKNWTTKNPILKKGELGVNTDSDLLKIGDDIHAWNELSYINDLSTSKAAHYEGTTQDAETDEEVIQRVPTENSAVATTDDMFIVKRAIAGDVPSWAKESNHATVDNLIETAISNIPAGASGAGTYTFTSAKLIKTVTQDEGSKITAASNAQDSADAAQADATSALNKIAALDVADSGSGFVTAVTQTDGKIAVTKKALASDDVTGVISFDGTYNASINKIAAKNTVTNAIDALISSVSATAASGNQYSVITGIT